MEIDALVGAVVYKFHLIFCHLLSYDFPDDIDNLKQC